MSKLEFIFPFIAVIITNKKLNKKLEDYDHQKSHDAWFENLKKTSLSESIIENIAHNIYASEDRRTHNIEGKGSSLLVGVGVSISLLSIMLGVLTGVQSISIFQLIAMGIFLIAIGNLILAAFGAAQAIKISIRYISHSDDFHEILTKNNIIIHWAAEHLANVEYNLNKTIKKSNWVDIAQQHFVRGLGLIVIGFVVLFWDIIYSVISGSILLDGLDFMTNFTLS